MLNTDLLNKVRDKIVLHPESHNQDYFYDGNAGTLDEALADCNTSACMAGWACLLSGMPMKWSGYWVTPDLGPNALPGISSWWVGGVDALGLEQPLDQIFQMGYSTDGAVKVLDYLLQHADEIDACETYDELAAHMAAIQEIIDDHKTD